jgi:tetratricopeptide (TPR) repeat protein
VGKPEEAEKTLRDLADRSTEPGPWLALLFFQVGRRDLDGARATVEQIKVRVTEGVEQPELLWAQCYRITGDLKLAEEGFEAARVKWPGDPKVARAASAFYEAIGRLDQAEALLRDAVAKDPSQRWAARALALILSNRAGDQKAWDEAWTLAQQRPDSVADGPEERLTRAMVLGRNSDPKKQAEAIAQLEVLRADLAADQPVALAARDMLLRVYLQQGRSDKVRELAATAADGSDPRGLAVYVEALLRDGQVEEARRQLERLQAVAPDDLLTAKIRAAVLKSEGKPGEAAGSLEEAFAAREGTPQGEVAGRELLSLLGGMEGNALLADQAEVAERLARRVAAKWPVTSWMLGQILARQKKVDEAIEACRAAVAVETAAGRDVQAAATLALNLALAPGASDGARKAADGVLELARRREPESSDLMVMTAFLRHSQGRYREEVELYRAAEERRPTNRIFLNNLAWTLSEELNQPSEALPLINTLLVGQGTNAQLLDTRAMILMRLDRAADAIKDLKVALSADPDNAIYHFHLARAYLKDGQEDLFRTHRELARRAGLKAEQLEPSERPELDELLKR